MTKGPVGPPHPYQNVSMATNGHHFFVAVTCSPTPPIALPPPYPYLTYP